MLHTAGSTTVCASVASHEMSTPVEVSSDEQVLTGLQSWPPDAAKGGLNRGEDRAGILNRVRYIGSLGL